MSTLFSSHSLPISLMIISNLFSNSIYQIFDFQILSNAKYLQEFKGKVPPRMAGCLNLDQILMIMNTFVPKFVGHLKRLGHKCTQRYDVSEGRKQTSISGFFLFTTHPLADVTPRRAFLAKQFQVACKFRNKCLHNHQYLI